MYVFIYEHKLRHYLQTDSTVCIRLYTKTMHVCVLGNKAPIAYTCNSYFIKIIKNKFDNNGIILIIIKLLLLLVHYYYPLHQQDADLALVVMLPYPLLAFYPSLIVSRTLQT